VIGPTDCWWNLVLQRRSPSIGAGLGGGSLGRDEQDLVGSRRCGRLRVALLHVGTEIGHRLGPPSSELAGVITVMSDRLSDTV
jgi:hypothetical protein